VFFVVVGRAVRERLREAPSREGWEGVAGRNRRPERLGLVRDEAVPAGCPAVPPAGPCQALPRLRFGRKRSASPLGGLYDTRPVNT